MKTTLKRILVAGLMVLGLSVGTQQAQAASTDTIVVSVTPGNPSYGVFITSPLAGGYDFGTVNLGQSTISTLAIVVKSTGTVSEYFAMSVTADGGWTPVLVDSAAPAYNKFELQGHFSTTQPADASFSTTLDLVTNVVPGSASGLYSQGAQTIPNAQQNLWLKLRMPTAISAPGQRLLTVAINGQST